MANTRVTSDQLDAINWKHPDEGALEGEAGDMYRARKLAVELYFQGAADSSIKDLTGLSLNYTYKLIKHRCLEVHQDGEVWGWRGLIPWIRINSYERKTRVAVDQFGGGGAGALTFLFKIYPELRKKFETRILGSAKGRLSTIKRGKIKHFKWLIDELRALGLEERMEWPFNTEKLGYVSICGYIKTVWDQNPHKAAFIIGGEDAKQKLLSGDGAERPIELPYQRVEMDAHKIDGIFSVSIPQPTGGYIQKIIHRLWVVVILDVVTRSVIGYHLSMRKEVSKIDVLRAIKMALTRWKRPPISFGEHAYLPNANLPSGMAEQYVGVCWDEISVDGALSLTCKSVEEVVKTVTACTFISPKNSFATRRSKDDRPFIETFFRQIGSRGFQQLTNTTGHSPKKKSAKYPDEIAITSQFQLEYAKELLDVLIANYNATPHSSLGGRSPLEYLSFRASQGISFRYADEQSVSSLITYRKLCTVKGGYQKGRRPYVNFAHGQYSNDTLAQRHDLIGKKIWIVSHLEDDVRVVLASTTDGQPLGVLRVGPPWHKLPHSLEVRNSVASYIRNGKLRLHSGADAIEVFIEFFEQQPHKKLPIHPAYLEVRRILTDVTGALQLELSAVSTGRGDTSELGQAIQSTKKNSTSRRSLPPPRKAAN